MKAAAKLVPGQRLPVTQSSDAGGQTTTEATTPPTPITGTPRLKVVSAISHSMPISTAPEQQTLTAGQCLSDAHARSASGDPSLGHGSRDTQHVTAGEDRPHPQDGTKVDTEPNSAPFRVLRVWAEMFEDAQKARISCANRAARGGVDEESYAPQLAAMKTAEHEMGKAMRKTYRVTCPPGIRAWQEGNLGIGEHLLARLLGVIGHPRHTVRYHWEGTGAERILIEDGPMERRVSDLWSYCGHGDAERKRRAGMSADDATALGSPRAKMLTRLLAESCMKNLRSPYRPVYDARRAVTAEGRPDWTPLRKHNDALRITGKAILRDLWVAAEGEGR